MLRNGIAQPWMEQKISIVAGTRRSRDRKHSRRSVLARPAACYAARNPSRLPLGILLFSFSVSGFAPDAAFLGFDLLEALTNGFEIRLRVRLRIRRCGGDCREREKENRDGSQGRRARSKHGNTFEEERTGKGKPESDWRISRERQQQHLQVELPRSVVCERLSLWKLEFIGRAFYPPFSANAR